MSRTRIPSSAGMGSLRGGMAPFSLQSRALATPPTNQARKHGLMDGFERLSIGRPIIEVTVAFEAILFEKQATIAKVTLNRPERLNAMTWKMIEEILDVANEVARDETVRLLVFT